MALPKSLGSYRVHMQALDLALVNEDGCRVDAKSHPGAVRFRQMAYNARKLYIERTGDRKWEGVSITLDGQFALLRTASSDIELLPMNGNYDAPETIIPEDEIPILGHRAPEDMAAEAKRMLAELDTPAPVQRVSRRRPEPIPDAIPDLGDYDPEGAPGSFKPGEGLF